jgi:hypothetical protein
MGFGGGAVQDHVHVLPQRQVERLTPRRLGDERLVEPVT